VRRGSKKHKPNQLAAMHRRSMGFQPMCRGIPRLRSVRRPISRAQRPSHGILKNAERFRAVGRCARADSARTRKLPSTATHGLKTRATNCASETVTYTGSLQRPTTPA
jgi:hypothetical protein